ncbi:MAG: BTAD domain-containing putative transcriptional regulator [Ilumatobacter sp.]|nr:BTAD domain-containing putative transcriptional regulator [Ilumatobacter sp.]
MQIRLLGGVEAVSADGDPIDVGPAKCQVLLASLALSVGSAVTVARLVELVWGEDPPRTAEKTLQSYITRLRKGLGSTAIERAGAAYRLAVDPVSVDVARFQWYLAAGDVETALTEWGGSPLAGVEAPGLAATVDGLVEQWLGALEVDLERRVDRDPATGVAVLTELTARYPFREGLWALLMTALYRGGRQADALGAYRRARQHLVEELGVEPGPRLRELESLVLGQDDRLGVAPDAPGRAVVPTGTVTFGFSDIEGSSRLWAAHRQEMAAAVARHDEIVRAVAGEHDGHVFATAGDSFGVAFHRAGDGARWATALQAAMMGERWPEHAELRLRIGLHTGEAEERADDYFGPAVNTAARIAAAGHGGQTLLSDVTATLLGRSDLLDLGSFRFDGAVANLRVVQLDEGEHPPLRTERRGRGNLPRRAGRLVGRDDDLERVGRAMRAGPVVTLVGPGGIGKTRLALAAARLAEVDVDGGAWFVELADIAASDEVARAVADVLDVSESGGRTVADSVVEHLEDRRALLVLDNCEHVVDGAARLAEALASGCPEVTVLATSREGLGVADEQLVVVGPLDPGGSAVELFAERARSADPGFDLDADRDAVEEICRALDGVPLAIELAAARVRSLGPSDVVERLDDRLRLLTGGRRRSVERHRTLRTAIQWSYDLLELEEQALLQRLSVFAGSFDLRAAGSVVADEQLSIDDVNDVLGGLVERSMVNVDSGPYGRRFRLLETIRQFAAEHLAEAELSDRFAARHAGFVRDEVVRLGELLASNREAEGAAQLAELWPNVRGAIDWAFDTRERELATDIIRPIALQLFVRRGLGEIADWMERLIAITPRDDEDALAVGLLWVANHYSMTQDRDRFRRLVAEAGAPDHLFVRYAQLIADADDDFQALEVGPQVVVEMRRRGEESYARLAELFTAAALMTSGQFDEARRRHEELAALFRAEGPPSFLNWTLYLLGASALFQGDHELADRYWEESTAIDLPPRTNSPNEMLSARAAFRQGRHIEAYRTVHAYIEELLDVDNMSGVAMVGLEFVNMMTAIGRLDDAAVVLGHFDSTGLLGVEGPGFKLLVADAVAVGAADPAAAAARRAAEAEGLDERGALGFMRQVLDELLDAGR